MKPDSIIFDIDGTLWDSTPIVAESWNQIVSQREDVPVRFTAQRIKELFGRPLPVIADMVFPFLEADDRYALIDTCCEREHELIRAADQDITYPDVIDTIKALSKEYKLFIVSNCQAGYIELFLEKTGLAPYIIDFTCPGDTGLHKGPNIRLITERNHLKTPVYVGDIEGDLRASKEAGVLFCHASYGFGKVQGADYTICQFSDLLTAF